MVLKSIDGAADISDRSEAPETQETVVRAPLGPRWHKRNELTRKENDDFLYVSAHWATVRAILGEACLNRIRAGRRMRGQMKRLSAAAAYLNWFEPVYEVRVTVRLTAEQAAKLGSAPSSKIRKILEKV
jgi:hypothetical protein